MTFDSRDVYGDTYFQWRSNFFFPAISLTWEDDLKILENYLIFQGPNNWKTLEAFGAPMGIASSTWDWSNDCSCAESNFVKAYVKRKSDKSIWTFKNWNPSSDIYTDFVNLLEKPVDPVQGVEYATFFSNGPPIPTGWDWNTLIIIK